MRRVLKLTVHPDGRGGWSGWVGPDGGRDEPVALDAAQVAEVVQRSRLLSHRPRVQVRTRTAATERAEEALGAALGALLDPPAAARAVALARVDARAAGEDLPLVVDAPELAELPWELIAWSSRDAPIEAEPGAVVLRLEPGGATPLAPTPALRLRALRWCPTPDDAVCAKTLHDAAEALGALGVEIVPLEQAPPADAEVLDLLHVICHGAASDEGVELLIGDDARHAGAISALLGEVLRRVALVILDVCASSSGRSPALARLSTRVVRGGALACVAPGGPLDPRASRTFTVALCAALQSGQSLVRAAAAARRAVAALAYVDPSARPHTLQVHVRSTRVAQMGSLCLSGWTPTGWRPPSLALSVLLAGARARAVAAGQAHVGLEHLVRALTSFEPDASVQRLRATLRAVEEGFWAGLETNPASGEPHPSPRLQRVGAALPPGAGPAELMGALLQDPHHGLHALVEVDLLGLLRDPSASATLRRRPPGDRQPATAFEVLWGPCDGTRLTPGPGQTLGRPSARGGPDLALGPASAWTDRLVSRNHLRFLGPGRVEALQPCRVGRGGARPSSAAVEGPLEVFQGDLLALSPGTWLRALAQPEEMGCSA